MLIQINETIQFEEGVELELQNEAFQAWFAENIRPQIDFNDSCTTRDQWQKPATWEFPELTVKAVYWTIDERPEIGINPNYLYNYHFKKFVCYGTV